jgi:DNA-binding Lrp family transcriptional regulator
MQNSFLGFLMNILVVWSLKEMIVFVIAEVESGMEKEVSEEMTTVDGVTEVYVITGEYDLLVKMEIDNLEDAMDLIMGRIRNIDGIEGTRTILAKKIKGTI